MQLPALSNRTIFCAFILLLLFGSGITESIGLRPMGVHQWRQSDSASEALNYAQNDIRFFTPQMHSQTGKNGFSASEFPLIYFVVGKLYQVFGFHEYIFKLINLLFFITGLWFLYLLCLRFIKDKWIALIPVIILGTSPFYFYYGLNFLPNVPAISCALIGWYFILKYIAEHKIAQLYLATLLFTLSALLKASDGLNFAVAGLFLLIYIFHADPLSKTIFKKQALHILTCAFIFAISFLSWVFYCKQFNAGSGTGASLLGILPIWKLGPYDIYMVCRNALMEWAMYIFNPVIWIVVICGIYLFFKNLKKINPYLRLIIILMMTGSFIYCLLWFEAFRDHDYYMLTPIVLPVFLLIALCSLFEDYLLSNKLKRNRIIYISVCIFSICYNLVMQHNRYFNNDYNTVNKDLYSVEPYLRSIGIKRTDLVVSVPDPSLNNSLYLMNNPGWTEAFTDKNYNIYYFIDLGAKYLIVNDSSYAQNEFYSKFMKNKIGEYKSITVYKF